MILVSYIGVISLRLNHKSSVTDLFGVLLSVVSINEIRKLFASGFHVNCCHRLVVIPKNTRVILLKSLSMQMRNSTNVNERPIVHLRSIETRDGKNE